jgi:hypothetical protein
MNLSKSHKALNIKRTDSQRIAIGKIGVIDKSQALLFIERESAETSIKTENETVQTEVLTNNAEKLHSRME